MLRRRRVFVRLIVCALMIGCFLTILSDWIAFDQSKVSYQSVREIQMELIPESTGKRWDVDELVLKQKKSIFNVIGRYKENEHEGDVNEDRDDYDISGKNRSRLS